MEKLNEIPGRQLSKEPDPLVQIRSAVHSNYAGMIAMLAADNRVYLGREECYHYQDGLTSYYDNGDGSLCFVTDRADMYYFLYGGRLDPFSGGNAGAGAYSGSVCGVCPAAKRRSPAV